MASARIGETGLVFGTEDETYGYFNSLVVNPVVQEVKASDGDGEIQAVQQYGKETGVTFDYVFRTATGAPTLQVGTGTPINLVDTEFNSLDVYINSASTTRTLNGFTTVAIVGTEWAEITTP